MRDNDVVAYIVIRILLFSSAFQHASAKSCKNKTNCKISQLAHREMMGAVVDLSAEMQRIEIKYGVKFNMANIPIGNIIYFKEEYFCRHILKTNAYPSNQGCKSTLSFVLEALLNAGINKTKSIFVENEHCLVISGKSDCLKESNQKQFWILNINLEQISHCCIEFVRHISP